MRAQLTIATELDNRTFVPGEQVNGRVTWTEADHDAGGEVRLFFYTRGKGTRDVRVVASQPVENAGSAGEFAFSLTSPPSAPPSFSGKLVSLIWAIEFEIHGNDGDTAIQEIIVSPTGEELNIYQYDNGDLPKYTDFSFGGKWKKK